MPKVVVSRVVDLDAGFPRNPHACRSIPEPSGSLLLLRFPQVYRTGAISIRVRLSLSTKGGALQSREENFTIHAFAFMIDNGILVGMASRRIGLPEPGGPRFRSGYSSRSCPYKYYRSGPKGEAAGPPAG